MKRITRSSRRIRPMTWRRSKTSSIGYWPNIDRSVTAGRPVPSRDGHREKNGCLVDGGVSGDWPWRRPGRSGRHGAAAGPAAAAPPGAAPGSADEALKSDQICTRCHDESETKPILSIYQTKHGVRGDARTPTCQSCHGESEKHLHGDPNFKGRAPPDVVYDKGAYTVTDEKTRAGAMLDLSQGHQSDALGRRPASVNGMACNNCHTIHVPADPILARRTQAEVCFTCHKTDGRKRIKISTHPIDAGKMACSDCHNPHGAAGPKCWSNEHRQRDLLPVPCRKTRSVPVGA